MSGGTTLPNLSRADKAAKVSTTEARRRKEVSLSQLRELEVSQKLGKLLPAAAVLDSWSKILKQVKDSVERIPDKCAAAVHAAGDVREARGILERECESILSNLADDVQRIA